MITDSPALGRAASGNGVRRRRLAKASEVADILGLPLTSLYDHARARRIPGVVKIGRRVLFDLDVLDPWLDAGGDAGEAGHTT